MAKKVLTFPAAERRQRQKIGGFAYMGLGLLLFVSAWFFAESFLNYPGGLMLLIGFVVLGYRKELAIFLSNGEIHTLSGFYFFQKKRELFKSDFQEVLIQRSSRLENEFSKIPGKTYDHTIKVRYDVLLSGRETALADASENYQLAKEWAAEIGTALKLPIRETQAKDPNARRNEKIMKWASVLTFLGILAVMAYVFYQAAS